MVSDERDKSAAFQHLCGESTTMLLDKPQFLMFRTAHGQNHPAAFGKLCKERLRNRGSGSSNEDGVERSELREPKRTVTAMDMRIGVAQPGQLFGSAGSKLRPPFDGEDFLGQT